MKKKVFTALGLMTGTSVDGVDLSLIKSDGLNYFTSILDKYIAFGPNLRDRIIEFRDKISSLEDLKKYSQNLKIIERDLTLFHAEIINEVFKFYKEDIDFIGFHGQTIFHKPSKKTSLQLGDGKLLSQLTQKIVVNDFRKNDLEHGGQGAPLAPIFHKLILINLIKEYKINFPLSIINIGGITNITQISNKDTLKAYDLGPGNCMIDEWIRKNTNKTLDEDGKIGKSGKVNDLIFNQAVDNFNKFSITKSLDVKDFDISFAKGLTLEDGCATITKFSAYLISEALKKLDDEQSNTKKIYILCGGGRKNSFLIENIKDFLSDSKVKFKNIDNYKFNGDYIESQAFAYLAIRSFLKLPISFPDTTRCKSPISGGVINKNF
tara:strand:- start:166 stop:1299 length:1134 start_codon:yes stop_codon:yes gene_type:complete